MCEKDEQRYSFRVQFLSTLEHSNPHSGSVSGSGGPSAALAGFDDHVGELLHFRYSAHVVEDGERLQVLRNAARGRGRLGVQRVVQAQQLQRNQEHYFCSAYYRQHRSFQADSHYRVSSPENLNSGTIRIKQILSRQSIDTLMRDS